MPSRQIGTSPGATRKSPRDMTGKLDERNKIAKQAELEAAAERMALATEAAVVSNSEVVDMTDEGRKARAALEQLEAEDTGPVEVKPQVHRVRVLADIEDMVFGREVINPGDWSDPNNIVYPEVGPLRFYNFQEGREYIVDHDMYLHLKSLEYIWD